MASFFHLKATLRPVMKNLVRKEKLFTNVFRYFAARMNDNDNDNDNEDENDNK